MVLDSSVFPLSAGSSTIAGFEWEEKTTDFTAEANKAYYCDTALDEIIITLPTSPSNGSEIWFFKIGTNKVNFIATDKIKGSFLTEDYGKSVSSNYNIIPLTYVDNITGWDWSSQFDTLISTSYLGDAIVVPYANTPSNDDFPLIRDQNSSDILYLLGTQAIYPGSTATSFVNPDTRGSIVVTASSSYVGSPPSNVCDNNSVFAGGNGNSWNTTVAGTAWLLIDFKSGKQVSLSRYSILNNYWNDFCSSLVVEGSNDTISWTAIDSRSGLGTYQASRTWLVSPNITSNFYRYIRFTITNTNNTGKGIMELCLWGMYRG